MDQCRGEAFFLVFRRGRFCQRVGCFAVLFLVLCWTTKSQPQHVVVFFSLVSNADFVDSVQGAGLALLVAFWSEATFWIVESGVARESLGECKEGLWTRVVERSESRLSVCCSLLPNLTLWSAFRFFLAFFVVAFFVHPATDFGSVRTCMGTYYSITCGLWKGMSCSGKASHAQQAQKN